MVMICLKQKKQLLSKKYDDHRMKLKIFSGTKLTSVNGI